MKKYLFVFPAALLLLPTIVSAHEVYVLSTTTIAESITESRFALLPVLFAHVGEFLFWASVGVSLVIAVFFFSIARYFEKFFSHTFIRIRPWAPIVSRITIGISFLFAALFQANYGPELPLIGIFGNLTPLATAALVLIGVCITMGIFVRGAAFIALAFFLISTFFYGSYMLTYLSYLGEIIVLILLGKHTFGTPLAQSLPKNSLAQGFGRLSEKFAPYSFLFLRITFGISLIYSAVYAKFWHNNLALAVAENPLADHFYGVAHYLGFEPHFLVLGAGIVEVVLGLFFLLGIEIRFTALFIEFWLALSLFYFGETVWPHFMLIGLPIAFIFYGYDKYSLEGRFFKKGKLEPIL